MLVRMNAQLAPIEAGADPGRHPVPGPRHPVLRPAGGARRDRPRAPRGDARRDRAGARAPPIRAALGRRLGYEEDGRRTGPATRPGSGRPRSTRCSTSSTAASAPTPAARRDGVPRRARRGGARTERAGSADGVNLLTLHRAKGLEWDAVSLPALEEGSLPIRQALDDDAALAEERRLLYVGHHPGARRTSRCRGRPSARRAAADPSPAEPVPRRPAAATARQRVAQLPDRFAGAGRRRSPAAAAAARGARRRSAVRGVACLANGPCRARTPCRRTSSPTTRRWRPSPRRARARSPALRRVKGMGPAKLDAYGDEILEVVRVTLGR